MEKHPAVYILASARNGTLYIGVTSGLVARVWQQRQGFVPGFTQRFRVTRLVWFEPHGDMYHAIAREKQIKEWSRTWKLALIERTNPYWRDLWPDIVNCEGTGSRLSPG
jgi:putative endonuclease